MVTLSRSRRSFISNNPRQAVFDQRGLSLALGDKDAGFLPNCLTTAQRNSIPNPREGLIIYNTEEHEVQVFRGPDSDDWNAIGSGGGGEMSASDIIDTLDDYFESTGWRHGGGNVDIGEALDEVFGLSNLSFYFPLNEGSPENFADHSGNDTNLLFPANYTEEDYTSTLSGVGDGQTGLQLHGASFAIPYSQSLWGNKGRNGNLFFVARFPQDYDFIEINMYNGTHRRFNLSVWTNDDCRVEVYDSTDEEIIDVRFPENWLKPGALVLIGLRINDDGEWLFSINEKVVSFWPHHSLAGHLDDVLFDGAGRSDDSYSGEFTFEITGGTDSPVISHMFYYSNRIYDWEFRTILGAFGFINASVGKIDYPEYNIWSPAVTSSYENVVYRTAYEPSLHFAMDDESYPSESGGRYLRIASEYSERPNIISGGPNLGKHMWGLYGSTLEMTQYDHDFFDQNEFTGLIFVDNHDDSSNQLIIQARHTDADEVETTRWTVQVQYYGSQLGRVTYTLYNTEGEIYQTVVSRYWFSSGTKLCVMWSYSTKTDTMYLCVNGRIDGIGGGTGTLVGTIVNAEDSNTALRITGDDVGVSHFTFWHSLLSPDMMQTLSGRFGYSDGATMIFPDPPRVSGYTTGAANVWISSQHFNTAGNGIIEHDGADEFAVRLSVISPEDWPVGGVLELFLSGSGSMVFLLENDLDETYDVQPRGDESWSASSNGWEVPARYNSLLIRRRSATSFVIQHRGIENIIRAPA